jgi:hypothetical protein
VTSSFVLGKAEVLGQKLPCEGDGLILEVVTEAEISQHFKEGMVPGGIADIVEVIVLAARADALLRGSRADIVALFDPVKRFLNCTIPELVNISVGSLRGTRGELSTTR